MWIVRVEGVEPGDGGGGVIGPFASEAVAERFAAALMKARGYPADEVDVQPLIHHSDYRVEEWFAEVFATV